WTVGMECIRCSVLRTRRRTSDRCRGIRIIGRRASTGLHPQSSALSEYRVPCTNNISSVPATSPIPVIVADRKIGAVQLPLHRADLVEAAAFRARERIQALLAHLAQDGIDVLHGLAQALAVAHRLFPAA